MAKMLCKGRRKDGSPCRGHGLEKYDGYCFAHRKYARGGRGAVADTNLTLILKQNQEILDVIEESLKRLNDGSLSVAGFNAIGRCLRKKYDIYKLDRQTPERYRGIISYLDEGMERVMDGSLSPDRLDALCNGADTLIKLYRYADDVLARERAEEVRAAAERADRDDDYDILAAAAEIVARQDRRHRRSLDD